MSVLFRANAIAQGSGKRNIWPTGFFPITNAELMRLSGIRDERTLRACRDRLKAANLIDYIKGVPNISDPEYRINYLKKNGYKTVPVIVPGTAPVNVSGHVGSPVYEATNDRYNNAPTYACASSSESLNSNGSSSPDSEMCTDTGAVAAAEVRVQAEPSGIGGLFGNSEFADFSQKTVVKPFAK